MVSPRRREHIARVTNLIDDWARQRGLSPGEAGRWHRAAILHDALKDAGPEILAGFVSQGDWPRPLWHGPAAAAAAARDGETDPGVLDAVRYHSTGYAGWDEVGKVLYLADYLEPGRTHEPDGAALAERVPKELGAVLREVAARRIARLEANGRTIGKETREFWKSLTADASSSS